ncbi:MAG: 1-acyl-sn-glycerol-3-phosphate acyltransferase [Candidatus Marinimicrobia bacterium]|nr:1-acyl-sn-glycerol-3-phosphate acyltransferase [Candidatus Neomarinimicrobiota bacterium]MBL7023338.1 1-acyl-sn-glycerol-3-phosphate acyltransferase [Candidatus Neomarinimicrobiota bacterium]MBL7109297.1 1-acyl-sn-glycerol-3-phosphate acyltransferase [Candidatus Neomarinimicrobiota bacterium]
MTIATILIGFIVILVGYFDHKKNITGIFGRLWGRWVLWSTGINYTITGLQNLEPNQQYIFVSNHESALDIPLCVAGLPYNNVFLAKKELFKIPIFGWAMHAAGMVRVNRQNREKAKKSIDRALKQISKTDISIMIYPEGTRTRTGDLLPFKKGSFLLAVKSGLPVVPITVKGMFTILSKHSFRLSPGKVELIIDKPITTSELSEDDRDYLLEKTRNSIQKNKEN